MKTDHHYASPVSKATDTQLENQVTVVARAVVVTSDASGLEVKLIDVCYEIYVHLCVASPEKIKHSHNNRVKNRVVGK